MISMGIILKSITLENFKGCKNKTFNFGLLTRIFGANASGKTTIFDALTWLLFNKDSLGSEKFNIRPLDRDGNPIHNVEIKVSAVFDVDGKEMEFTKVQKEKWVKKRGTDTAELQGNENLYEVDGYPRTEKDYKAAISDLVSEDLFKMLTNPTYFPSLKWKEQRDILMRFVSDVSDYELAKDKPEFAELLSELQKAPSTDDIRNKYQKSLTEWKKKQAEIPVRIDEAEKSKVVIDVAEMELGKKAVQKLIDSNLEQQKSLDNSTAEQDKVHSELMQLQFKKSDFERKENESVLKERQDITVNISGYDEQIRTANRRLFGLKADISNIHSENEKYNAEIAKVREQWNTTNNAQFDENEQICRTCGQLLPTDKISANRAEFEAWKKKDLAQITERGNHLKGLLDNNNSQIKEFSDECEKLSADIENWTKAKSELEKKLSDLPTSVDVSGNEEYKEILRRISEKEEQLKSFTDVSGRRRELLDEERKLRSEMAEFERKIDSADNSAIDERIAELQEEQRAVAQKVADAEKMVYLLESFMRYKMDVISESINGKFELVNFILFRNQINGALAETCECEFNGVPYSSLNSAAKIQCGLDIIRSLQKLYGISCFVFIDNRESCTEIPKMDCQVISMYVSPADKELRLEVE